MMSFSDGVRRSDYDVGSERLPDNRGTEHLDQCLPYNQVPDEILASSEEYGCRVNNLCPDELFGVYARAGFLYPAKLSKLAPFMSLAQENWRRAMQLGTSLLITLNSGEEAASEWATVAGWRTTHHGWFFQHLASMGNPARTGAVLLGAQAFGIQNPLCGSYQNWFRPENRFPARVFGTATNSIGPRFSSVQPWNLVAMRLPFLHQPSCVSVLRDKRNGKSSGLCALAEVARGKVYSTTEELEQDDLELDALDQLYSKVGLRRYREVWLAWKTGSDLPVGAAIAYRGPLGLNFSFLENRCDLILNPNLNNEEVSEIALSLLAKASSAYEDFPPRTMVIAVDDRVLPILREVGADVIRRYSQSLWLREGFIPWYRHVQGFYQRIDRTQKVKSLAHRRRTSTGTIENQTTLTN